MNRDQIQLAHFRSIKEEYAFLRNQLHKLWSFKFSSIAVVIILGFLGEYVLGHAPGATEDSVVISFVAISFVIAPILAFLIDLRMLESALYVKIISEHLKAQFSEIEAIQDFESRIWEDEGVSFQRTLLSFLLSVVISVAFVIMSFFIVVKLQPNWETVLLICGAPLVIAPFVALFILVPKFLKRKVE